MKTRTLTLIQDGGGDWTLIGGGFDLDAEPDVSTSIVGLRLVADQLVGRLVDLRAARMANQIEAERQAERESDRDVEKNRPEDV